LTLESALAALLSFANTFLGTGALCWLGLWFGLAVRRPMAAVFYAVGLAQGVPWLASLVVLLFGTAGVSPFGRWFPMPYAMASWLPEAAVLLFNIGLFRLAGHRLAASLMAAEPTQFDWRQSAASAMRDAGTAFRPAHPWTPS